MKKYPISFRLTEVAQHFIDLLSDRLGISKTGVIETAVRELAKQEGLYYASSKVTQDTIKDEAGD